MKIPDLGKIGLVGGYLAYMNQVAKGHGTPFGQTFLAKHREAIQTHDVSLAVTDTIQEFSDFGTFGMGRLLEAGLYGLIGGFIAEEVGFKPELARKIQKGALNWMIGVGASGFVVRLNGGSEHSSGITGNPSSGYIGVLP